MRSVCSIDTCPAPVQGHGWCGKHYARWRRHGDPLHTERPTWHQPPDVRFWAKVDASGVCWEWTASDDGVKGYGRFEDQGVNYAAHRWAYMNLVGPIPDGMTIDHLCRNKACVNPDHFELVTARVNTLRGGSASARNARKTHCPQNHEYTPDNTRISRRSNGLLFRTCRTCARDGDRKRRAA